MRLHLMLALLSVPILSAATDIHRPQAAIAVLDFELNDLTLEPNSPGEVERTASIKPMLEEALAAKGYRIVYVELTEQRAADKGFGYLFDHADAAAALGQAAGADWVIAGRLHKASFLFAHFKVHVINVRTEVQAADLVVEVKGPQKALTDRGVDNLALQITAALGQRTQP